MHCGSPRVTQFLSGVIFDLKLGLWVQACLLYFFFYNLEVWERLQFSPREKKHYLVDSVLLKINLRSIKIESEAASEQQANDGEEAAHSRTDMVLWSDTDWPAVLCLVLLLYKYISKLWNKLGAVWLLWHDQTNLPILSCLLFFLTFLWPRGFPIQET